ncbi:MAG TPA: hydrogen peroxide-inducible genes activator [Burkholderiaceae bacterium]|nr:hydrogen peroxide-inducible genes activator [Burkholderiaceae bacterium]
MNLRDLQYLVAVADHRHFGRAAEACHVSQPTLSMQLAKLEEYLGVKLFERTNRAVQITPVGERIAAAARLALDSARQVIEIARESRDPLAGTLRLGVLPTLAPFLMPWLLRPMRSRFPKLQLSLTEETTEHLIARLQRHEVDAAFLATPVDDEPGLQAIALFDEPFWLAAPRGHPLARCAQVTRKELSETELLMLSDEHCLKQQTLEVCRHRRKVPVSSVPDLRASSLDTLLELVAAGIGCTLIPALATRGPWARSARMELRPLEVNNAFRRVALVFRTSYPRMAALTALADLVRAEVPRDLVRVVEAPAPSRRK